MHRNGLRQLSTRDRFVKCRATGSVSVALCVVGFESNMNRVLQGGV